MFKDTEVVSSIALGTTKYNYLINFGLATCFKNILVTKINALPLFVISFDESLNSIFQNEQMDVLIKFWNNSKQITETRYFDSVFLNRPNAKNLFDSL